MQHYLLKISQAAWRGATIGVIFFSLLIFLVEIFGNLSGAGVLVFGSVTSIIGICIIAIFSAVFILVVQLFARTPWYYQSGVAAAVMISLFSLPTATNEAMFTVFTVVIIFPSLLGGALADAWKRIHQGTQWKLLYKQCLCAVFSICALLFSLYWLTEPGFEDASSVRHQNVLTAHLALPNPGLPGMHAVKTLYYGSGKDLYRPHFGRKAAIKTEPVDGSPFVSGWEGWTGWLRTYFWGFDSAELPLNGRVWYPEGEGPFPLVLFVHGNHTMSEFSDIGYEYLGSLLASQGMITVSVDQNFLNSSFFDQWSSFNENPARGWILLKHLSLWRQWNVDVSNPFFNKVDLENIGLMGHSRGGEAIVTASAFNKLPFFPEDGTIAFDFNFSIKALAAIAPKDGGHMPAGNATPLENVNYFAMHGSHDSDVRSFEGTKAYSRLVFDDGKYWFKAALYVIGANHGQFNEVWDRFDATLPESLFLNLTPLLSNVDQRKVASVYLSAFFKATLNKQEEYIPLFWDARLGKEWLPETLFLNQFEDSRTAFVYSGKKDLNMSTGTMPGSTISQENLTLWRQEKVFLKRGGQLENAIFAGWREKEGSLSIGLPAEFTASLKPSSILIFSLADAHESPEKDDTSLTPWNLPIDFTVEVVDAAGQKASLPISSISYLFPQVTTQVYKANIFDTVDSSEIVFQSFRLPLASFIQENSKLNVEQLRSIRFVFNITPYGVIIFDRIGFTPGA